ncbi:sugar phosphate isomerase/epimerase family protein [Candidatus Nitrosotalea okcheonensis]|uniref:Xylose isomerase domain protein TIM barrel (Modular protein) n=1 Tax=Candidatus Nitrosotalea okcheonensis TaxID=1903276 RepID=A0A2H1FF82_9ARCH|nr:sugar phosphate isomerase/epimerase family protein [Candidatus Nitrosotalea okcheonensis]SMH71433.1 Putative xylose isomerase domain protein TIM barrel (modular protein) [Candidatus Nitrosotalea okcheonensis]
MGFKYSITLHSFRKIEPIEQTLSRLKKHGYDAVEMFGEPDQADYKNIKEAAASHGLTICGITGMWGRASKEGWKRKLLSLDQDMIKHSENYVRKCINMCQDLGGNEINICLFADSSLDFDANHGLVSEDQKKSAMEKAVPLLISLSRFAADHNVSLLIEPLNRYSTPYCNTAKDAAYIAAKINQDNVGILLDTFHMNIEESSFEKTILDSKSLLRHTHFSDNNRAMPGYAHLDFATIVKALRKIKYHGYISFEPNLTADYESSTLSGLQFIKKLEKS